MGLALTGCNGLPIAQSEATATLEATATATTAPSATPSPTSTATLAPTATATALPTATPVPTLAPLRAEVKLDSPEVEQGSVGTIRVTTNRPTTLRGTIEEERQLFFFSPDGLHHMALVGVHALAPLGHQPLRLVIDSEDGQQLAFDTEIKVIAGDFVSESLQFTPEVAQLLDPKISEPENIRMMEVFNSSAPDAVWQGLFDWPVEGTITSEFGTRRLYQGEVNGFHTGLDIDGETGDTVLAAAPGVVVLAEELQVRGRVVIIDHGAGVMSGYFHLDEIGVEVGQEVEKGEPLGKMGSTGLVTGSHLHWEMRVGGVAVSPQEWLETDFAAFPTEQIEQVAAE
ncbi:MAG: M23 family metallopeptidase [Chloroflexi bacterium]|nr:M23 family metallopeptidase [Chloroflexota bacterium]